MYTCKLFVYIYHTMFVSHGLIQENAAGNALDALAKLSQPEVSVMRGGEVVSIPTVPQRRRWRYVFVCLLVNAFFLVISQC